MWIYNTQTSSKLIKYVMLPLHHTKMMIHLHLSVMIIFHLQMIIHLTKGCVSQLMTGVMKVTSSVVICVCGAIGRAYKRDCPMTSRSSLPMAVYSTDSQLSQFNTAWEAVPKPKPNLSNLGKRKSQEFDKHRVIKKQ